MKTMIELNQLEIALVAGGVESKINYKVVAGEIGRFLGFFSALSFVATRIIRDAPFPMWGKIGAIAAASFVGSKIGEKAIKVLVELNNLAEKEL